MTSAITTTGSALAGQTFALTCNVTKPSGLSKPFDIQWRDANGPVTTMGNITVSPQVITDTYESVTITFSPLRTSDGGVFACQATVNSTTPPFTIVRFAEYDLLVES